MKNFKIGLQLYSVRDDIAKDIDSTLGKVKEMGYDYVEFAGGYAEKTAEEVRALLDKHELVTEYRIQRRFAVMPAAYAEHAATGPVELVVGEQGLAIGAAHQHLARMRIEVLCFWIHVQTIAKAYLHDIRAGRRARYILYYFC